MRCATGGAVEDVLGHRWTFGPSPRGWHCVRCGCEIVTTLAPCPVAAERRVASEARQRVLDEGLRRCRGLRLRAGSWPAAGGRGGVSDCTNEHGRFQLQVDHEAGTARMVIENVNREGEH